MDLTDRTVQAATLKLIGALAARLAGGPVALTIQDDDGNFLRAVCRESDVEWLSPEAGARASGALPGPPDTAA